MVDAEALHKGTKDNKVDHRGGQRASRTSWELGEAIDAFGDHMVEQGFAENTWKAFMGDLGILRTYLGEGKPVTSVSNWDLNDFMRYLLTERGRPCSPKSYARRLTTLKVFFAWLTEVGAVHSNPADALVHRPVSTPMPETLHDDEVARLLSTARDELFAAKPDARPYLLISLILQTGIKKSECVAIELRHLDVSSRQAPVLEVRYKNPRMAHKERRLALSPQIVPALEQYLRKYQPKERLFECTARNLEYVLQRVAEKAEIAGGVSFEQLRWTAAVWDYRRNMPEEQLRRKLGLSMISWRETLEKVKKLAEPAL